MKLLALVPAVTLSASHFLWSGLATPVWAQDPMPPCDVPTMDVSEPKPAPSPSPSPSPSPTPAITTISGGASALWAGGNSSSLILGGSVALEHKGPRYRVNLDSQYLETRIDGTRNQKMYAAMRPERLITERFRAYGKASYNRDTPSGLARQFIGEAGVSIALVDQNKKGLRLSSALADINERRLGRLPDENSFWGAQSELVGVWPLGNVGLEHRTGYLHSFHRNSDWRLNHSTSAAFAVNRLLTFKVSNQWWYLHVPSPGKLSTDKNLLISLILKWSSRP